MKYRWGQALAKYSSRRRYQVKPAPHWSFSFSFGGGVLWYPVIKAKWLLSFIQVVVYCLRGCHFFSRTRQQ